MVSLNTQKIRYQLNCDGNLLYVPALLLFFAETNATKADELWYNLTLFS